MTTARAPSHSAGLVVALMLVTSAAAFGIFASADYQSSLMALAGIGVGALILYKPILGVLVLVLSIPVENIVWVAGQFTATRVLGVSVAMAWMLRKLVLKESWKPVISTSFFLASILLLAMIMASQLWAPAPLRVRSGTIQMVQMIVLGLLVIDVSGSWERLDLIIKALVVGALAAALMTQFQSATGAIRAGDEIAGGVNSTALVVLTIVPFGFYLFRSQQHTLWKLIGLGYVGVASLAVLQMLSRLNLLLLPLVVGGMVVASFRGRTARGWLVALLIGGTVGAIQFTPWEALSKRSETIIPYIMDTVAPTDRSQPMSGRGYHLRIGLEIAADHPIIGAGYNNYGVLFRDDYQFRVHRRDKLYRSSRSPHSSHIGMLADLGIIGASLWLFVLGTGLVAVIKVLRRTKSRPATPTYAMAQAIFAGLLLHIFAYGWYSPNQREKILWILLGLAVAASQLANGFGTANRELDLPTKTGSL